MIDGLNFKTLWTECEALYPAIQDTCLTLQDEHGVNVNLLLLALYLDNQTDLKYNQKQWLLLLTNIESWERKIVQPYRKLRRIAKGMIEQNEYQQMLDLELMMERKTQKLISNELKRFTGYSSTSNLMGYLGIFGENLDKYIPLK